MKIAPYIPIPVPERTVVRDHRPVHLGSDGNTAPEGPRDHRTDAMNKGRVESQDLAKIEIDRETNLNEPGGIAKVFGTVDKFDSDGPRGSLEAAINTRYASVQTPSNEVFNALKLEFDRKMTQAQMNGPQKAASDKLKP